VGLYVGMGCEREVIPLKDTIIVDLL
jgi:hypothetical protein